MSDDNEGYTYEEWRTAWRRRGMPWDKGSTPTPEGWDPVEQLKRIGVVIP